MQYLSMIFFQIVAPILLLLVIGGILQKKFHFNLKALSQLITFCFMPAAVFVNIYETNIEGSVLGQVVVFIVLFIGSQMIIGRILAKLLGLGKQESAVFKMKFLLQNTADDKK